MEATESVRLDPVIERMLEEVELTPQPYRHNAYDLLCEGLVNRLNGGSLDEPTRAVVEMGLLVAAGLYRIERAIGMAADRDECLDVSGITETFS